MEINEATVLNEDILDEIKSLEKYCGVKFPESYVEFIKYNNIGVPATAEFTVKNIGYVVDRFLGIVKEYKTSVLGCYDIAVVLSQIETRLSDNPDERGNRLIPIAILFAGDFVCIDYRKDALNPSICIWDHEASDEFAPATIFVADSFDEFIKMLV